MHPPIAGIIGVGGNLPMTIDDAREVERVLANPRHCGVPQGDILVRIGPQATRAGILEMFDELATRSAAEPERPVLLFYSGHGHLVPESSARSWYLVPTRFEVGRPERTGIRHDELARCLGAIRAPGLLVALDCCFAAGFELPKSGGATPGVYPELLAAMPNPRGRLLLASSRSDEPSWAPVKGCSYFTQAFVEGLCGYGGHHEGVVDAFAVASWVTWTVPKKQPKQHPVIYAASEGFPLAWCAGGASKASRPALSNEDPGAPPAPPRFDPIGALDGIALPGWRTAGTIRISASEASIIQVGTGNQATNHVGRWTR